MKRLSLVRHAKSSWKDERLPDVDRPLSGRGKRDAPAMGERLRARRARPSLILCSHAERAKTTAKSLADALGYPREFIAVEPDIYLADAAELHRVVAALDDRYGDVMLVGHNPGLTDFVNRLLPSLDIGRLPTAGVVTIDFPVERWADLGPHGAELVYVDYPKKPRA
jgi:phosphohistidine phosphatase